MNQHFPNNSSNDYLSKDVTDGARILKPSFSDSVIIETNDC